ncbi:MAG: hypothetical protein EXS16_15635 [Gemmataceae bacterium]|nr:hypothetical protein [Gemmataceae bacterium]
MITRLFSAILATTLLTTFAPAFARAQSKPEVKAAPMLKRDDVFTPGKIWSIHLRIGAKDYPAMNPKGGGMFGFPFPKKDDVPPKKDEKNANADTHKSKAFGMEFPWVKGDLEFEDAVVKEIGIRYKGNSTYKSSENHPKRPLKLDINHFHSEQKLHGLSGLSLGNNIMDQTRLRETLAYSLFHSVKLPAPRTAFAKVHLTVPDKYDRTYIGLYTLIEPVDKPFLREHFKNDNGMLLKPERVQGIMYLGDNWTAYNDKYNPKREPTDAQKKRFIEFAKLVNTADDATFKAKIGDYLDVDGFLRYAAVNSLLVNIDSFFGLGHNYFLYLHPKTKQFHFIPWDMDLAFGGFFFAGPDQIDWSIAKPYTGNNKLTERVLAIGIYKDAYRGYLKTLTEKAFNAKIMMDKIEKLEAVVKDAIAKEPPSPSKGFGFGPPGGMGKQDLRNFIAKRTDSVIAQLDGKSQGKELAGMNFGKGPPGGFGKGPFGFGPGQQLAKPVMEQADTDKNGKLSRDEFRLAAGRLFKAAGGDGKTPVSHKELVETLERILPPPPGFGGFKPPPPPKGFGPAKGIVGAMFKVLGSDPSQKVSRDEFLAGAEKLFKQWDKDNTGTIDERRLMEAINQVMPPPQFGPGPGPFQPKKDAPRLP